MKTTRLILSGVVIAMLGLTSCSKEDLLQQEQEIQERASATAVFENPFEEVGQVHNSALQHVLNDPEFDTSISDQSVLIYSIDNEYLESQSLSLLNNDGMIQAISDSPGILIHHGREGETVKPTFWDYVQTNYPANEYDILREYYDSLSVITDMDVRKTKSLEYEELVHTHKYLKQASKDRMLRSFAIYRHSSVFWENHKWKHDMSEAMGLFAEYVSMQYSEDPCAGSCAGMAAAISAMAPGNGNETTGAG